MYQNILVLFLHKIKRENWQHISVFIEVTLVSYNTIEEMHS